MGERERYVALRDVLTRAAKAPARLFSQRRASTSNVDHSYFWALKNVSFEIRLGEVVGIIGRNGAGKSTLLKILARVSKPSCGSAEVRGRMGTLLEVGTGFHPELTGRENVFLSGAILGMRKAEIHRRFDEIVAFAEVQSFIDTPLKHYSTGMQMRLAFSVAAHLEPEILLVDEVLSVGDLEFQKKCLGKMGDVAKTGRTILFVSHQMNQIRRLCDRVLWVNAGRIRQDGSTAQVAASYESATLSGDLGTRKRSLSDVPRTSFRSWEILEPKNPSTNLLTSIGPVSVRFSVDIVNPLHMGHHGIALFCSTDRQLVWAWATDNLELSPGAYDMTYCFPYLPLRPGPYYWQVSLWDHRGLVDLWDCLPELVIATNSNQHRDDSWNGILNVPSTFSLISSDKEWNLAADTCV